MNRLTRGERARSLNQTHQWIDLMIMLMLRNDQSLTLYRRRTQLARTISPPPAQLLPVREHEGRGTPVPVDGFPVRSNQTEVRQIYLSLFGSGSPELA